MREPAIDALVNLSLDALQRGELVHPHALALLLREYADTGRSDIGDAVGAALARAIDRQDRPGSDAQWLVLFVDAIALADDPRLLEAARSTAALLRSRWPQQTLIGDSMAAVEGCLRLQRLVNEPDLLRAAIDELERIVGLGYGPGSGVRAATNEERQGDLGDHADAANALLTAYAATGRLPYAMLADDLMQFARRRWWDEMDGGYRSDGSSAAGRESFLHACRAVRVLCRLAVVQRDPDYREVAVVVDGRDHAADARRALERLAPFVTAHGIDAALYGLAFGDCLDLQ